MNTNTYINSLAIPLQNQLRWLYRRVGDEEKIYHLGKKIHKKYGGSKESAGLVAILKYFTADHFLNKRWTPYITGYSLDGQTVELRKEIKSGKHVHVYRALMAGQEVIAKWYSSYRHDTSYEIEIYRQLSRRNCPLPWFSDKFLFWQTPLLVMEKLEPLGPSDDPYQVGIAVLRQFEYLHQFAVHNGIKPDNIMRKGTSYSLIDFGGTTMERLEYGYRRWLNSPDWTSQERHVDNQITTAKNDLLELGFTMKSLCHWNSAGPDVRHARRDFPGRLKRYMKTVDEMDPKGIILTRPDYGKLIQILSE